MAILPLQYNTEKACIASFLVTAGVALTKGQEVKYGANLDTIALATDALSGIGIVDRDVPINFAGRVDVVLFGSPVIVNCIGNGTAVAGQRAISAGNGKFAISGATPDARTLRGTFHSTSAVDGAPVSLQIG